MAIFPKIQSPCPFKGDLNAILDGDVCRLCHRQLFNLDALTDAERVAFMQSCSGEVCVSYSFPLRAAAAAAITVLAMGAPTSVRADGDEIIVTAGAVRAPQTVSYISDTDGAAIPDAPVIHEDESDAATKADKADASTARADLGEAVPTQQTE